MAEKRRYGSWIGVGLATLVAGALGYAYFTSHEQEAKALSESQPAVNTESAARPYDAGARRNLNTVIASIRESKNLASAYRAVPAEGYTID
ncbi:MAG: hypothetical protein Q7K45_06935, partial [Nanoarchaeota archaeon]|nr:hypothetical protein [Nanoarchaeota archaeon]